MRPSFVRFASYGGWGRRADSNPQKRASEMRPEGRSYRDTRRRRATADLLITNQPFTPGFSPENDPLGGYLGGYRWTFLHRFRGSWDVISDFCCTVVPISPFLPSTYGVSG